MGDGVDVRAIWAHRYAPDVPVGELMTLRLERCGVDPEQAGAASDDESLSVGAYRRGISSQLLGLYVTHPEDAARLAGVDPCRTARVRIAAIDADILNCSRRPLGVLQVRAPRLHTPPPVKSVSIPCTT